MEACLKIWNLPFLRVASTSFGQFYTWGVSDRVMLLLSRLLYENLFVSSITIFALH